MQHPVFATTTDRDPLDDIRRHVLDATIAAARKGVRLIVTFHDAEGADELIAEPIDVTIDHDGVLTVRADGRRRVVALAGPDAPAILPSFVPCDANHRLAKEVSAAVSRLRENAVMIEADDRHGTRLITPDMIMVASTGIYAAGVLGVEWEDEPTMTTSDGLVVIGNDERSLELRAI